MLETLFEQLVTKYPNGVQTPYAEDWPSDCVLRHEAAVCSWLPKKRMINGDFSNIEKSLDISLHPSVAMFYGQYWSGDIEVFSNHGKILLLQNWNQTDFEQLQANLIGHILMKRKLEQAETLFIGLTEEEDTNVCILNQTGEVVLEPVGLEPKAVIAPNLNAFIDTLQISTAKI
jgi:SecY interacting protein Syd